MTKKKLLLAGFVIGLLLHNTQPVSATDIDELVLDDLFLDDHAGMPTDLGSTVVKRSGPQPVAGLALLSSLGLQDLLRTPLYLRTNPIMRVPLLDLPMFQEFILYSKTPSMYMQVFPFYGQTYSEHFYKNQDHLNSYIALQDPALISAINNAEDLISVLTDQPKINIPELLPLFHNLKAQERRTGFMNQFVKNFEGWSFLVRIPVYYQEHNLYLTPAEQQAVSNNPFFQQFAGEDYMQFARQHLICDAIGLGDTRINIEFFIDEAATYQFGCGVRATLPTGCSFKKGIYGSAFPKDTPAPDLQLNEFFATDILSTGELTQEQGQQIFNYGEAILNRLSTLLLNQPMGNGHHVGLGIFTHSRMRFSSWISLGSLTQVEVQLPCGEQRFFYLGSDLALYQSFNWSDPMVQVEEKFNYLNKQLQKKFFPPLYSCIVFPGVTFQNTTALLFEGEVWNKIAGTDLWIHSKEYISHVKVPHEYAALLDINKSRMGAGYQTKLWGSIERNPKKESYWIRNNDDSRTRLIEISTWTLGLRGEIASNSYTVGGDWGISFYAKNEF